MHPGKWHPEQLSQQFTQDYLGLFSLPAAFPAGFDVPRKEKTTPFGVNLTRSQVLYWAAFDVPTSPATLPLSTMRMLGSSMVRLGCCMQCLQCSNKASDR